MSDQEMELAEDDNDSENETMEEENEDKSKPEEVYLPNKPLDEGEELICDQSAYVMLHQAQTGAPCLSFDVIRDSLGDNRETYPLTAYIVAGTQASQLTLTILSL
jgi:ribosome assembly protein RRB1